MRSESKAWVHRKAEKQPSHWLAARWLLRLLELFNRHYCCSASAGTAMLLEQHPDLIVNFSVNRPEQRLCRKDTGESKKLRKWSRGHQFIVRGGGHIDSWQPLYRLVYIHYEHCMHEPWLNARWSSVFVVLMACQWRSLLSYLDRRCCYACSLHAAAN